MSNASFCSDLFAQIPVAEHAHLKRLLEMTVLVLAHMPPEQRFHEYARAEILHTYAADSDESVQAACAE